MELKHGELAAAQKRRMPRGAFVGITVIAAGLIYFGTQLTAAKNDRPAPENRVALAAPRPQPSCDSVFTEQAKNNIEAAVGRAVSGKTGSIRDALGLSGNRAYLSVSVGVDSGGRVVVEDVWAYPEPQAGADPRQVLETGGLNLEGIRVLAPADGTRCTYTVPVNIAREI
ncbi:MAG TPA: hypothetical protein VLD37_07685 [Candidatus Bilamarchaeum sp.]|nr:hypothetical protein [Candidatus Bilamarchaeum sp.]